MFFFKHSFSFLETAQVSSQFIKASSFFFQTFYEFFSRNRIFPVLLGTCNHWLRNFKPLFLVSQPKVHYTEDIKEKEVEL